MNIYIGSLPPNTSARFLINYFKKIVKVADLRRIKNKGRKSPGYAILKLERKEDVEILLSKEHRIEGNLLLVKPYLTPQERLDLEKSLVHKRIYIKNLPENAEAEDYEDFFKKFGKVISVVLKKKQATVGTYGFITFENEKIAQNLIDKGSIDFKGTELEIKDYIINDCKFKNELKKMDKEMNEMSEESGSNISREIKTEEKIPPKIKKEKIQEKRKMAISQSKKPEEEEDIFIKKNKKKEEISTKVVKEEERKTKKRPIMGQNQTPKIKLPNEVKGKEKIGQAIQLDQNITKASPMVMLFKGYPKPSFLRVKSDNRYKEKLDLMCILKKDSYLSRKHDQYNLRINKPTSGDQVFIG